MKTRLLFVSFFALTGCKFFESAPSNNLETYLKKNQGSVHNRAQVDFALNGLESLNLSSLQKGNILPIKVYGTALLLMENDGEFSGKRFPEIMQRYGFLRPSKIDNWNSQLAPEPKIETTLGFVEGTLEQEILGQRLKVHVGNITCAACHSGMTYDSKGNPTGRAWLGAPNTSLNFDGFLNQIYQGLKKGLKDQDKFVQQIKRAYPEMDSLEEKTIREFLLPRVKTAIEALAPMGRVLPFPNGGPGMTNGVAAFKRNAGLLPDPNFFDREEAGFVAIPDISSRGFRSSLTVDGAYGVPGKDRSREIDANQAADPEHQKDLADLATFFTFSATATPLENVEKVLPVVRNVMKGFIAQSKTAKFPGEIDFEKADRGYQVFQTNCQGCHGTYEGTVRNLKLTSFPNRFVRQDRWETDRRRWEKVSYKIAAYADRTVIGKYVDAGAQQGGYFAPMLTNLWLSAPYLHNGSVPTLWHLMHPEDRPSKFRIGGQSLDFAKMGLRGSVQSNGVYEDSTRREWATSMVYDTSEPGRYNGGHEMPFAKLSESEKSNLLEFLKLL